PGLHRQQRRALNRAMNRTAAAAALDADLVVLVVEAMRFTEEDEMALARARESGRPVIAVVNKVDKVKPREKLLPYLADLGRRHDFAAIVPVSALDAADAARLVAVLVPHLPESPPLFPADQLTD